MFAAQIHQKMKCGQGKKRENENCKVMLINVTVILQQIIHVKMIHIRKIIHGDVHWDMIEFLNYILLIIL